MKTEKLKESQLCLIATKIFYDYDNFSLLPYYETRSSRRLNNRSSQSLLKHCLTKTYYNSLTKKQLDNINL